MSPNGTTRFSLIIACLAAACGGAGAQDPGGEDDGGSGGAPMGASGQAASGGPANGGKGGQPTNGAGGRPSVGSGGSGDSGVASPNPADGSAGASGSGGGAVAKGSASTMQLISRNVPAFASTTLGNSTASKANDGDPATTWSPQTVPSWIAYDLSGVPLEKRQAGLVAWNDGRPSDYIVTPPNAFTAAPTQYTFEVSSAAGGGSPPSTGWNQVVTVSGNDRATRQHAVTLAGANWVRMSVTQTMDPAGGLFLDLDVYSVPSGATDSWMLMGDSITFLGNLYPSSDLPALVQKDNQARYPAIIDAAISGTSALSAVNVIDATIAGFLGHYVVLAYGTNDLSDEFPGNMETLIKKVIASGRVPVVPHMPWSDQRLDRGPMINASIDALYAKYPEILHGPDLWAVFLNRNDLIPPGDLHPNDLGKEEQRRAWAQVIAAAP